MRLTRFSQLALVLFCLSTSLFAAGQSAVITLTFPPGARATGLGEAFVAVADDANATFFNPAGLGQQPLSNAWNAFALQEPGTLTSIASKTKKEFGAPDVIWSGTNHGLLRFNGKAWESYERHLVNPNESLADIARKYFTGENNDAIVKKAAGILKTYNGIEQQHSKDLAQYLKAEISDSICTVKKISREELTDNILDMAKADRTPTQIYGKIATSVDSLKANKMSDDISAILAKPDLTLEDLVEIKVPFTIAITDSVTALQIDGLDRVWVGTPHGLWRYDGTVWSSYSMLDGLSSNSITTFALSHNGDIIVGTTAGACTHTEDKWKTIDIGNGMSAASISALAYTKEDRLCVGTAKGIALQKDSTTWTSFDSSNGLLSNEVKVVFADADNKIWVGGPNGVAIFDASTWKRYKFPGSTVNSIIQQSSGIIWIGTNRGAITYKPGKTKIDAAGKLSQEQPEWQVYHSKNALKGDDVRSMSVQGQDIWLATDNAFNQYKHADGQILLFYESLLPSFKLPDLWHFYLSWIYPTDAWGTLGLSVNFINFGTNDLTDEQGQYLGTTRSWEGVFGLSYGLLIANDLSTGINIKYAHSQLAPNGNNDEGIGRTFAIDVGLLKRNLFVKNFDIGLNIQNMGPSIYYISQDQQDPIPFTIKLGFSYLPIQTPYYDLRLLLDFNREIVKNNDNGHPDPFYTAIFTGLINDTESVRQKLEEVNVNCGAEFTYANFLALRIGDLFDYIGKRFELTMGLGVKYGNMNFDWSYIYSPEGFMKGLVSEGSSGVRDGQWRASFIFKY